MMNLEKTVLYLGKYGTSLEGDAGDYNRKCQILNDISNREINFNPSNWKEGVKELMTNAMRCYCY